MKTLESWTSKRGNNRYFVTFGNKEAIVTNLTTRKFHSMVCSKDFIIKLYRPWKMKN